MVEGFVSITLCGDPSEAESCTHLLAIAISPLTGAVSRARQALCVCPTLFSSVYECVCVCFGVWVCGMDFRLRARSIK